MRFQLTVCLFLLLVGSIGSAAEPSLRGEIRDGKTNEPLAARVYIRSETGKWFHPRSASKEGAAIVYNKQRGERSVENHTALSAHPFEVELPAGKYLLTVERGKEFLPHEQAIEIKDEPVSITVKLQRWFDMAKLGYYSGETHVHRTLEDLPAAMLADDLNVAFPLTYWVTKSDTPPTQGDKNLPPPRAELVTVDPTHVIYPLNTEYELFTVGGKQHTLGAVFALNQKTPLELGAPPVRAIAEQVHREGGLLELDKHNWPWSMMLVPVMDVDLYELGNNHDWRTEFGFGKFGDPPPDYMKIETDESGMTEKGWIDYTFQNYYALLNCGFRLRPTAGTASGVHPVPLGFSRVYVNLPDGFTYEKWLAGLNAGRSFVTTGPLLLVQVNDGEPGSTFQQTASKQKHRVFGWARSVHPMTTIEIVSAGAVVKTVRPQNTPRTNGGYESSIDVELDLFKSTWLAVRCYEATKDGRVRFAHTAPAYIDVANRPLRPRPEEINFLVGRMEAEIKRNTGILSDTALQEFRDALAKYKSLAEPARKK